jgi:transcriptional regulator with XRE-family HTH domain
LRREELATLAGLSIDYLIRLEQGRDTNPSPSVIAALADALRLSDVEKRHLVMLALKMSAAPLGPPHRPLTSEFRPTLRTLLDRLHPTPAFVAGPLNDVLGWNDSWKTLVVPLGIFDEERPNLARYLFLNPAARRAVPDWDGAADGQASMLRAAYSRFGSDDRFVALLDDLRAVPAFVERWDAHTISTSRPRLARVVHPGAGDLRLSLECLAVEDIDLRLEAWLPYDEATEVAMRDLLAAPLRIVRHA